MVVDVYLAPASAPCRAVLMTAQQLGVEVNQKIVNLMAKDQLKPEYLKMNLQHTVPTIDDNGFYLAESRAIQAYLVNKYAPDNSLYPVDPQKRAIVDRMLYFDAATLYKAEGDYLYPILFANQPADQQKLDSFKNALSFLEQFLGKTAYVAGNDLTIADLSILSSLTFIEITHDFSFEEYPKLSAWLQKLKSDLPYYKDINEDPLLAFKKLLQDFKH